MREKTISKETRKEIEKAYKQLEEVRKHLRMIHAFGNAEQNQYYEAINAEENRLLRFIENAKGLNEPNMN